MVIGLVKREAGQASSATRAEIDLGRRVAFCTLVRVTSWVMSECVYSQKKTNVEEKYRCNFYTVRKWPLYHEVASVSRSTCLGV